MIKSLTIEKQCFLPQKVLEKLDEYLKDGHINLKIIGTLNDNLLCTDKLSFHIIEELIRCKICNSDQFNLGNSIDGIIMRCPNCEYEVKTRIDNKFPWDNVFKD